MKMADEEKVTEIIESATDNEKNNMLRNYLFSLSDEQFYIIYMLKDSH